MHRRGTNERKGHTQTHETIQVRTSRHARVQTEPVICHLSLFWLTYFQSHIVCCVNVVVCNPILVVCSCACLLCMLGDLRLHIYRHDPSTGGRHIIFNESLFGIAPHEETYHENIWTQDVISTWQRDDQVEIHRMVGGGGGHRLLVKDFTLQITFQ